MHTLTRLLAVWILLVAFGGRTLLYAREPSYSAFELFERSDMIVIGTVDYPPTRGVDANGRYEVAVPCTIKVSAVVKGEIPAGETFSFVFPNEEHGPYLPADIPPRGSVAVLFLRSAWRTGRPDLYFALKSILRESFTLRPGEEKEAAVLLSKFVGWEQLKTVEKEEVLKTCLARDDSLKIIALDAMCLWEGLDSNSFEELRTLFESESLLTSVLAHRNDSSRTVRKLALGALAKSKRWDLIAYVIDALDIADADMQAVAVAWLEQHRWRAKGTVPALPHEMPLEEKVAALKKWWAEVASKDPRYNRYIPAANKENRQGEDQHVPVPGEPHQQQGQDEQSSSTEKPGGETNVKEKHAVAGEKVSNEKLVPKREESSSPETPREKTESTSLVWATIVILGVACIGTGIWGLRKGKRKF